MSIVSALDNQNRVIRVQQSSTATAASATSIYITLNGWPSWATLSRLLISANNNFGSVTATVFTDGALYRASSNGQYVQAQKVDTTTGVNFLLLDMGGVYVEDGSHANLLCVRLTSTSPFVAGTIFSVTAEGRRSEPATRLDNERTHEPLDQSWRVLMVPASGTTLDVTDGMLGNSDPYRAFPNAILSTGTDHIYIGSARIFARILARISTASQQPAGNPLTSEYWNGTTWSPLTVADNTSDGQATASTLSYSGAISFTSPADWSPIRINTDPVTVMAAAITAGTLSPIGFLTDPARFWVRISVPALASPVYAASLSPLV